MSTKSVLGKIFSAFAAAAVALPLIALGQNHDVIPGHINSGSYVDIEDAVQMVVNPAPVQFDVLTSITGLNEIYTGSYIDKLADTHISANEAAIGYSVSMIFSGASLALTADKKRKGDKYIIGAIEAAGESAKSGSILSVLGSITDSDFLKNTGAGLIFVGAGILMTIPPYLAAKSITYSYFMGEKEKNNPEKSQPAPMVS